MGSREVVVVGGGPGGLSAALAAARAGARVTIIDAYAAPGGQYYHQPPERLRKFASRHQKEGRELWERVLAVGVEICSETAVWDLDGERNLSLYGPAGIESIQAERLILATGAYERTIAFPGWTTPGVITAGAAQSLLYHHTRPTGRVLVVGAGPLQLVTAANLVKSGANVVEVLEGSKLRPDLAGIFSMIGQWGRMREGAESLASLIRHGVPYRTGWGITAVHGKDAVEGATVARLDRYWRPVAGSEREIACNTVCIGHGLVPFNTLSKIAGAKQEWRPDLGGETPCRDEYMQTSLAGIYAVGDGAGIGGYRMSMLEGQIAGMAAAADLGHQKQTSGQLALLASEAIRQVMPALRRERAFQAFYARLFTPGPGIYELAQADTYVCRCEGVRAEQITQAVSAGATTLSEVKAATRCGMGECQGRVCGHQVMQTVARLTGKSVASVGAYTARPPLFPIPISAFSEEHNP